MIKNGSIWLFVCLFIRNTGLCQSTINFEQYHIVDLHQPYMYMPVIHYQHKTNWYAEARYNYEAAETFSLYLGRAFKGGNALNYSFVPLVGGSIGRFSGISTGLNVDLAFNKFFFSSQSQYSKAIHEYGPRFWYSWSELGYQSMKWLYAGLSVQHTYGRFTGNVLQPGMMIGFVFKRFTMPVYAFDPFTDKRNFIVGMNMAWKRQVTKQLMIK